MEHSDMYDNLLGQGMNPSLAAKLDEIHQKGLLAVDELDDRALEALKEFTEEDALNVLGQFMKSDLSHVQNKSAFLCGVMKTYRAKMKLKVEESAAPSTSTTTSTAAPTNNTTSDANKQGPNEDKVKTLLNRTGYTLDITTGQRKYGGPPPGWEGSPPGTGAKKFCSQVFIGKLPRDMYEDELVPLFENYGQIYDLRIMVDPFTGLNKGYAFCTFTTKEGALDAVSSMDKYEVRDGRKLGVCLSQANNRLFVGSIPKSKTKQDILEEFSSKVEELSDVIVYISSEDKTKNRGFAFLEFSTHKDAALARRKLMSGRIKVFGNITPTVDWADPIVEPDEETMSKVKVVYVRNLSPAIDESKLNELFQQYGAVEKVKKLKDYAFIHFMNREDALRAIEELDGQELDDLNIQVSLAKPQVDKSQQRRGQSGFGALNQRGRGTDGMPSTRGSGRGRGGFGGRGSYGGRGGYGGGSNYNNDDYYSSNYEGYDDNSYDDYYGGNNGQMSGQRGGRGGRGGQRGGGSYQGRGGGGSAPSYRGGSSNYMGRGRGNSSSRGGGGGYGQRNNRGAGMGQRGGRGGMAPKRKADFGSDYGTPQKRKNDGWNSQPIAQQPLNNSSNNYYNDDYSGGQDWYTDLSTPRWQ